MRFFQRTGQWIRFEVSKAKSKMVLFRWHYTSPSNVLALPWHQYHWSVPITGNWVPSKTAKPLEMYYLSTLKMHSNRISEVWEKEYPPPPKKKRKERKTRKSWKRIFLLNGVPYDWHCWKIGTKCFRMTLAHWWYTNSYINTSLSNAVCEITVIGLPGTTKIIVTAQPTITMQTNNHRSVAKTRHSSAQPKVVMDNQNCNLVVHGFSVNFVHCWAPFFVRKWHAKTWFNVTAMVRREFFKTMVLIYVWRCGGDGGQSQSCKLKAFSFLRFSWHAACGKLQPTMSTTFCHRKSEPTGKATRLQFKYRASVVFMWWASACQLNTSTKVT